MVREQGKEPIVQVTGFRKYYSKRPVIHGVDLAMRRGEMYGLVGPDGAGKSSLLKAIAGVLSYEGGEVNVFGVSLHSERTAEWIKARIGFLPQGLGQNLYPDLSVEENIDFFARLRLVPEPELASKKHRLLNLTRLEPFRRRLMKHLSGGMKQKLGLVCTLIHEPELIILDEPTTGVDPVSRRDFWSILSELVGERGLSALISTAYMDEVARFHRLSLMFQGVILASGKPSEIHDLMPGVVVTVRAQPQMKALAQLKKAFQQVEARGPILRVFVEGLSQDDPLTRIRNSLKGMDVKEIQVQEPEAEDTFVGLVRQRGLMNEPETVSAEPVSHLAPMEEVAIEARALTRDFGAFRAVDGVTFQLKEGEIFGLLGSNGAGKTTVIKMLTGLLRPSRGEAWVAGVNMSQAAGIIKERIGYMSQAFSLYLDLTVVENIRLFAGVYGLEARQTAKRLRWLLNMAGLTGYEAQLAGRLPMGVRQRLALGCALVHQPRVLFLDEPTSGVDPIGRRRFWEILLRLSHDHGVALLVTTHYMMEAEHCDRLALMYAGKIVSEGTPSTMKEDVEKEAGVLLEVVCEKSWLALSSLEKAGFSGGSLFGTSLHLLSLDPDQDERRVRQVFDSGGIVLLDVKRRPLTLEDVFIYRINALEKTHKGFAA